MNLLLNNCNGIKNKFKSKMLVSLKGEIEHKYS